ncbi:hypothetical protein BY458DRAFT_500147 [Sporodiniella umbellata]|nr:hypothetical protein BY458DRAFT_500147 [Sporodiniella umbellata]
MTMLHEDEDPLSNSIFDTSNTFLGNTMSTSMFSTQYEEDPWGNSFVSSPFPDPSRSLTAPNFNTIVNHTTSDAADTSPLTKRPVEYNSTNVLSGIQLPKIYDTLYSQNQRSGRVSLTALNNVLSKGRISANHIEKIMQIVAPNGVSYVTQSEFNTAVALLTCAQNKLEITIENLYRHRENIPEPQFLMEEPEKPLTTRYPGQKNESIIKKDDKPLLDTRHWFENVEQVAITVAPEREGFIFKHVNYIVTNEKRSSIVLRRYSDFWWLWEVLLKRYPFRAIPNLPPKKFGGKDVAFLEKRRRGLSRFINAIIRHPVLRQDEVVSKFLTEPSELAVWRKQNQPSLDEEFKRKQRISVQHFEALVPENLDEQLQKTKKRVSATINHYINLCLIMERMIRRMNGQAADFSRYSIALNSLAEADLRYHAGECVNCQCVVRGYETVSRHMQIQSNILESQVGSATDGILENLKRFRDLVVSFRDLEERRRKLSLYQKDDITKRLSSNRAKLHQTKGIPGMETEAEKLQESIRIDEEELSVQEDRLVFIRYCMWSEMIYMHKQQAFVSTLYQNYAKDTIHFAKLSFNNWQELEAPTFEMPVDVSLFE